MMNSHQQVHISVYTRMYIYIYVGGSSPTRAMLGNLKADDHPTGHPHTITHVCIGTIDGHGSLGSDGDIYIYIYTI